MIFCKVFDVIGDSGPRLATARATTSLKKKSFLPFSFHVLLGKKEETGRGERESFSCILLSCTVGEGEERR